MMRTAQRHMRRGLTLLELLVAVTLLASLLSLVAALWAQVDGWAVASGRVEDRLRLAHFERLAQTQWNARLSQKIGEAPRVVLTPGSLSFITSEPILEPASPVVLARYAIEPAPGTDAPEASRSLIYEETPVQLLAPGSREESTDVSDEDGERSQGQREEEAEDRDVVRKAGGRASTTVIAGAQVMQWQRWFDAFDRADARRGWGAPVPEPGEQEDDGSPLAGFNAETDDEAGEGGSSESGDPTGSPRAVRMIARVNGREVAWLFSGEASP